MYEPNYTDSLRADILPSYSDSLMHHGIKGMHWGIRRFQNADGSLTAAGRARYNDGGVGKSGIAKRALKGAAIGAAVGLAAGAGLYAYTNRNTIDTFKDKPGYDPETGLCRQVDDIDTDPEDSARKTNPKARWNGPQTAEDIPYFVNCTQCSVAYDLRRKGFNVEAGPAPHGRGEKFEDRYYRNAEKIRVDGIPLDGVPKNARSGDTSVGNIVRNVKTLMAMQKKATNDPDGYLRDQQKHAEDLLDACESFGPNSRGAITLTLHNGMAHSIAFECDDTGKLYIRDSQMVGTFSGDFEMGGGMGDRDSTYIRDFLAPSLSPYHTFTIRRYDNAEPDYDFLKKHNIVTYGEGLRV